MRINIIVIMLIIMSLISGCTCNNQSDNVMIPIELLNANNLGSFQLTVSYDPDVLEVIEVRAEGLAKKAMLEFNADTPGLLIIGIVDSAGINGNGLVAKVDFKILQKDGQSRLQIESAQAHNVETLVDIAVNIENGSFDKGKFFAPMIALE